MRRRVLVVDDQKEAADMLGFLLGTVGQDVRVAYDGVTALACAREQRPQVAFLDISMPQMSGAELARRLREDFPPSELKLVALTGLERGHVTVQDGEFDHHLEKPITVDRVLAVLNTIGTSTT